MPALPEMASRGRRGAAAGKSKDRVGRRAKTSPSGPGTVTQRRKLRQRAKCLKGIPAFAGLALDQRNVLCEEMTLGDHLVCSGSDSGEVAILTPVALLDRQARVVPLLTLAFRTRERQCRAGERAADVLPRLTNFGVPKIPAQVGRQRHAQIERANSADLIAVGVQRADEDAVVLALLWRVTTDAVVNLGPKVKPRLARKMPGKPCARDGAKCRLEPLAPRRRPFAQRRHAAGRRLDSVADPAVEVGQRR